MPLMCTYIYSYMLRKAHPWGKLQKFSNIINLTTTLKTSGNKIDTEYILWNLHHKISTSKNEGYGGGEGQQ